MVDGLRVRYGDLLEDSYDCVDRIVLNAYFSLGHSAGGFRVWWRALHGGDEQELDTTHLIRMAGRFARRVRAWANAGQVPLIDCGRGVRKHEIAEEYLASHTVPEGVFMVLVSRGPAPIWQVSVSPNGARRHLSRKRAHVNHYSFHIWDRQWGHVTIKMSGHPPFGAQVILNGHEYVACAAPTAGIGFTKEGNCFTSVTDTQALAQVADTLSQPGTVGRLAGVCDHWIYTACLCFGLDLAEQRKSRFRYNYSVYQVEYSRNLIFRYGGQLEQVFTRMIEHTRQRLDVPTLRTLFGAHRRPRQRPRQGHPHPPRLQSAIETPSYDVTTFKVHFGSLTLKAYTKGERICRFEAIVHNTRALNCGRILERFTEIVTRLHAILDRFCDTCDCVDAAFIADDTLDQLPQPARLGATRFAGIDLGKPRIRDALAAVLALAAAPDGFTVAQFTTKVHTMTGHSDYTTRQAAYDLRKLRAKNLITKPGPARRYHAPPQAIRTITALLVLRDQVIKPILAGIRSPRNGPKPKHWTIIDRTYETIRIHTQTLFTHLGLTYAPT
jgi:hypothetical protein